MTNEWILGDLDELEAEAIYVMREAVAQLERPLLLFSGGKDSTVLLRIAEKAFRPARFPFPLLHIDTGHNFPEVLRFRDRRIAELGERLVVRSVQDAVDRGLVRDETGPRATRNRLQTAVLLDAVRELRADCVFGGARREEERSRAKERFFSFRDEHGQWDPKTQRAEPWAIYNGRVRPGEHMRVFPLSNWTELDVWRYVERERLALPEIYFAHTRETFERDGFLLAASEYVDPEGSPIATRRVRFRTVGDMTCTAATLSSASSVREVIVELAASRVSERGESRADDTFSEAAMEDRKRLGYF